MRWLALLLIALVAMFVAPRVQAETTCSVTSVTGLTFGGVNPTGAAVDITATLTYQCTYSGVLGSLYGSFITMCPNLGPDDLGNLSPRTMVNANNDRMQYQAFKDAGRTSVWGVAGNATYAPPVINRAFTVLQNGATLTGTVTVFGRVPAGQTVLSPGSYGATLANNSLTYSVNEILLSLGGSPATCGGGGTQGARTATAPSLTATASVAAQCTFGTATDLNFGSVSGLLRTNTDQASLLRITCTNRAAYQLGLDQGQNAGTTGLRRMAAGTRYVNYELYRDTQRTLRWGTTLNSDTFAAAGNGVEQTVNVYGRVPVQPAAQAGSYSDIVTVTVTY